MSFADVTNFFLFFPFECRNVSQKHTQIVSMGVISDNKDGVRKIPHKEKIYCLHYNKDLKKPLTSTK